jgi:hypothetical protein
MAKCSKVAAAFLGFYALIVAMQVQAGDCKTVCDSSGMCSMECPSEAPAITAPPVTPPTNPTSPKASGNSCKYAYDGVCDDPLYRHAKSSACPSRTDEADCQKTMPRYSR